MGLSSVLKILADENRLRILNLIKGGELCVGEISTILGISRSNASKHLEKLKMAAFISARKDAQWIYYSLKEGLTDEYVFIRALLFDELSKEAAYLADLQKLSTYRQTGLCCQDLRDAGFDFGKIEETARTRAKKG